MDFSNDVSELHIGRDKSLREKARCRNRENGEWAMPNALHSFASFQ